MRHGVAWFGFWIAACVTVSAWAWPYRLRVRATECGNAAELGARVQRRLMRPEPENWSFYVGIVSVQGEIVATITSVGPSGAMETRSVRGAQCGSVLDAAALVIAVTLDPSLALPKPELRAPPPTQPQPMPRAEPAASWHLGARAGGGARRAIARTVGWELSVGAVVLREASLGSELAMEYVHGRGGIPSAVLTLDAGRLYLVPVRLELGPSLYLSPAAGVEVGRLKGSPAQELIGGRGKGGLWTATSLQATLTLRIGTVGPGGLDLSLTPFLALPLKRDTFEASARDERLYKVRWWEAGARAGATFWLD
ncbi:MAG: hypothetical protein JW940_23155 [Polyangiaceae bacterium]|nr:hypothetical protein [Polyangiaceae bacterium]